MTRQDHQDLLNNLREQLAEIEENMKDNTLSHSDQELMDQAWEDISNQIEELEDFLNMAEEYEWRDAEEFFAEEDEEEEEEPGKPSVTVQAGVNLKTGKIVTFAPPPPKAEQEDCRRCSGCVYCSGFDSKDEV